MPDLAQAILWGAVGASALLLGAVIALRVHPRHEVVGLATVLGFIMSTALAFLSLKTG